MCLEVLHGVSTSELEDLGLSNAPINAPGDHRASTPTAARATQHPGSPSKHMDAVYRWLRLHTSECAMVDEGTDAALQPLLSGALDAFTACMKASRSSSTLASTWCAPALLMHRDACTSHLCIRHSSVGCTAPAIRMVAVCLVTSHGYILALFLYPQNAHL